MGQMRYAAGMRAWMLALPTIVTAAAAVIGVMGLAGCGGGGGGGTPPAKVIGRILLVSTGQPLNGATVTVGGSSYVTGTNAVGDGNFVLISVPSTATQIMVTGTGVKALTQTLPTLVPIGNQAVVNNLGDVYVLDNSDPTADYKANVKGTVVRNDTFAPVQGATVQISGQSMVTGADGVFQFTNLPTGLGISNSTVSIGLIKASGFEDKPISLGGLVLGPSPPVNDLGQIPITLPVGGTPPPPANIKGKVTVQGLTDLSGTIVTLVKKSDGSTVTSQTTKSDGLYGFFVVADTYTVQVSHPGFTNQQQDITLARPDQVQVKDFALVP